MNWNLLLEMSDAFGIPSQEEEMAGILERELLKHMPVKRDRIGNVIGETSGEGPKIMLGAHMDEIGLMVKFINEKGFIKFIKVGGIDDRVLLNQRVIIKTSKGKVFGTIGNKPPHLQKDDDKKKIIEVKNMFIDVGARSREEAKTLGVRIGDGIGFEAGAKEIGIGNNFITGKGLDDRVGCFVLAELAARVRNKNLVFVGTTQEEVSTFGKGAMISAYVNKPDYFIAIDTGIATDHPECSEDENPVSLEKGPAITLVEAGGRGNVSDRKLVNWLISTAEENRIPYQLEAIEGGSTDAAHVYNVKEGIPSVAVSIPVRYIHSNVGVLGKKDVEWTISLMEKALQTRIE